MSNVVKRGLEAINLIVAILCLFSVLVSSCTNTMRTSLLIDRVGELEQTVQASIGCDVPDIIVEEVE